jgi:Ca2+-binding RTX toxin-like protein
MATNPLQPTAHEQYLLELINRARLNPEAEVQRNPKVDSLNEDLAPGTISNTPKQPLAFSLQLIDAARQHSQWMLNTNTFSHTGAGGSNPGDRMRAAGYTFTGSWTWGENIAWNGTTGTPNVTTSVAQQHENLFDSPGHRSNLMNESFKEVGLGVLTGTFSGYNAVMTTQKFAKSGTASYLTGVVFDDKVLNDDFYTVGEGLGGITVTARRSTDNAVFSTTTFGSGGYQLALTPANYQLTFSGGSLTNPVTKNIALGSQNVKVDLATDTLGSTGSVGGSSGNVVKGTSGNNTLTAAAGAQTMYGYGGNDSLSAGAGNDTLYGGSGNDTLRGGTGNDHLYGGAGNDRLFGVNSNSSTPGRGEIDRLTGGDGGDRFILGDSQRVYYTDGNANASGLGDYGLITDFKPAEGDVIQLKGAASSYRLSSTPSGLPTGTAIFLETSGVDELIGIVQGASNLGLNSPAFSYV